MKKIVLTLFAFASFLIADTNIIVIQNSMYKMEMGLNTIQKGYLYNNIDVVKSGIADVREANKLFKSADMKSLLPDDKKHMVNIANNSADRIVESLASMEKYINKHEMINAHKAFGELINACTTCHSLVRNW